MLVALAPMFAVIGPAPGLESEAEYAYETLWNGVRVIAHLPGNGSMRLLSQTGVDVTDQYPELKVLPVLLPGPQAVLDGEIITLDGEGRPSVERLQQRMSLHHPQAIGHAVEDLPVQLMLYDILYLGEPTVQLPYTSRRDLLDDLALASPGISVPAAWYLPSRPLSRPVSRDTTASSPSASPVHTCPDVVPATGSKSSTWCEVDPPHDRSRLPLGRVRQLPSGHSPGALGVAGRFGVACLTCVVVHLRAPGSPWTTHATRSAREPFAGVSRKRLSERLPYTTVSTIRTVNCGFEVQNPGSVDR
ncbi:ATP-dependent DNA ligase [Streptomyces mirabilis]